MWSSAVVGIRTAQRNIIRAIKGDVVASPVAIINSTDWYTDRADGELQPSSLQCRLFTMPSYLFCNLLWDWLYIDQNPLSTSRSGKKPVENEVTKACRYHTSLEDDMRGTFVMPRFSFYRSSQ